MINLISTFIEKEDDIYRLTELITKKAGEIKHPSFVQTLLTRLEKKTQYYDYRYIVRALLAYKDNDINKKLKETIQSHEHLAKLKTYDEFKPLLN